MMKSDFAWVEAWRAVPVIIIVAFMVGCAPAATPLPPTSTPRPTQPPRAEPTALPTPVDAGEIAVGDTVAVTLPGQAFVHLTLTMEAAQAVTITAAAQSDDGAGNPLDVVLEVLDGDNNRVAYDDDGGRNLDGLAPNDAAINDLSLEPGTYMLRVNAFNGFQAGALEVRVVESGS